MDTKKSDGLKFPRVGSLDASPSRASGKLLDEWSFTAPSLAKNASTETIPVKVYLVTDKKTHGLTLEARSDALPGDHKLRDTDIEKLRDAVRSTLEETNASRMGFVWEDWLKVTVSGSNSESNSARADLTIAVEPFKRAVHPQTGDAFYLHPNGRWAFPLKPGQKMSDGADFAETGEMKILLRGEEEVSYVSATPETLAALADARNRLRELRLRLAQALSQEQIGHTLTDMGTKLPLLGGPAR